MPVSPYTKPRLTEAARSSRNLSECLTRLGVDPKSSRRNYIRERMRKLDIDTSHFEREGTKWTREILEEAVAASTTMCEVLQHIGLDVVGGHHTHISRRVKALGIDTSHFRIPAQAGRPKRRPTPEELLVQQEPQRGRRIHSDRLRAALKALGIEERCADCGIAAVWLGEPLPLEVDHINGDWHDNRPENLRFLCPNCHSTTDTYRGRGKGRR